MGMLTLVYNNNCVNKSKSLAIIALKDSELTLFVAEKTTILKDLRY